MEGAQVFVATISDSMVACGITMIMQQHSVAGMFGAGTLTDFRGRGLQTALLHARMATTTKNGCEYAVVVTQGGTTSQRNCESSDFAWPTAKSR